MVDESPHLARPTLSVLVLLTLVGNVGTADDRPTKAVIGAAETVKVVLPTSGDDRVTAEFRARIDTGAATNSIHAENIQVRNAAPNPKQNVGKPVTFTTRIGERTVEVRTFVTDAVVVRTSEGAESRYKVLLETTLDGRTFPSKYTLNDRSKMTFPVLVGRNALRGRFVVDVEK